ncbi:MAG: DUF4245 domain-containing protein [Leucobacter sp.]|jgi:hypothetical protein|nr:DUF4245 domain-containing protein [Leucobacter sp.]
MAKKTKQPVVVAELGRPETTAETAARKANDSRLYRQRKTVNNLVFSLLVSVGLMFVIVLIVPRGTDQWKDHSVNVAEAAELNTPSAGVPLIAPAVPESWLAKQAVLKRDAASEVLNWFVTYTTENEAYAAFTQALTTDGAAVNGTWIAGQLENQSATGTETIGGLEWTVYDHPRRSPDESNMVFGLEAQVGNITLLVYGTDRPEVLRTLAADIAAQAIALDLTNQTIDSITNESAEAEGS